MKPKWIKVGETEKDIFDILDLIKKGISIGEIANIDISISMHEILELILRTEMYLQGHLILDRYLETVNKLSHVDLAGLELEWTSNEKRELVELHASGASIENISTLMRKDRKEIEQKLQSLNVI